MMLILGKTFLLTSVLIIGVSDSSTGQTYDKIFCATKYKLINISNSFQNSENPTVRLALISNGGQFIIEKRHRANLSHSWPRIIIT